MKRDHSMQLDEKKIARDIFSVAATVGLILLATKILRRYFAGPSIHIPKTRIRVPKNR